MRGPIRRRIASLAYLFCKHDWQEVTTLYPPEEERPANWLTAICNTCGKPKTK
jgi:hypothetical protein